MVSCCSFKTARRGLLAINSLNFIFGLAFIGVGAVSIQKAAGLKTQFDVLCQHQCDGQTADITGCDCVPGGTSVTSIGFEVFSAPGAGLVSVGVFSVWTACLGIVSAVRGTPTCVYAYIGFVIFIIVLQFSFGAAAAAIGTPESINLFGILLERGREQIDWTGFGPIMPRACTQALSVIEHSAGGLNSTLEIYHPACTFNGFCEVDPKIVTDPGEQPLLSRSCCVNCRFQQGGPNDGQILPLGSQCGCVDSESVSLQHCITGEKCLMSALHNIGGPVAGLALSTLVFEILAVCWAFVVARQAKSKSQETAGDVPMDEM